MFSLEGSVNPLLPAVYDIAFSGLLVAFVAALGALWIGAFVSVANHREHLSGVETLGWFAFITFAQFIGPLVWFLAGRPHARRELPTEKPPPLS